MDIGTVMNTMRDPAGLPAHPALFQALMVLTWVFHIFFVHLTLGATGLALWGYFKKGHHPHWSQLSVAMTQVAKVGVSLLIVLGVAPLLFTQVVYDPQWYTSNVLSARWVIAFIFTLIVAYCLWFFFYSRHHDAASTSRPAWVGWLGVIALGLFALDGLIMHALTVQAIAPEQWMAWYTPGGQVDTSGSQIHRVEWGRYAFIMSLSAPMTGLFLWAYADYFAVRPDITTEYLSFTRQVGQRLAWVGFAASAVLALWWQMELMGRMGLAKNPVGWLLWATVAAAAWWSRSRPSVQGQTMSALGAAATVLTLLAVWRELIRVTVLADFNYSAQSYTVHTDWPSLVLFLTTLMGVGGLVGGYFLSLLYQAGRTEGVYEATPNTARLGTAAVYVLIVWVMVFFAYGIAIYLNNKF